MSKPWRTVLIAVLAAGAAGAAAALLVRDQVDRHQRGLFSPRRLQRLAALGHFAQREATIDDLNVLRDYVAREPIRALRKRAVGIIERMERDVVGVGVGEPA
ncbi:MAG: hypothetical protein R3E10_00220 [Gemmatimonadota bacterium]